MFPRISRASSASARQRWLVRVALALGAIAICVTAAGVIAARQQAGQRIDDTSRTAKAVFDQSLARHAHSRSAALAAARATGAEVTLGTPTTSGRVSTYALRGGRRLTIVVSDAPVADATRTALLMGLGIGAGAFLVLLSLLAGSIERPLAKTAKQPEEPAAPAAGEPPSDVASNQQFQESLGIEVKRAQRDNAPLGLVVLDIDGFGSIKDSEGRGFADEVLERVADALRGMMRATDLLAHLGGDDFALILPGTDGTAATAIAERARRAVAEASTGERRIACSAGVASYPEDARDSATLLQLAGGALRWAKASGRGQTRRYDPKSVFVPTDAEERAEIERLLAREQPLVPFFQPLVSLSTGRILGFEALSRFPEPPGRGPDAWFAQAARCGLGARLEAAALSAALSKPGRPAGAFLSINVSPSTISSPEVQAVLPEDMSGLVVEITEHELAENLDQLAHELASLRERGARIAVDDAGAGYSGLQQVMRIQPDVIKLDRSLVMNLHEDPAKEALIDSFVRFARRTGASVCAEGIETMEELKLLADLDVTYGQGYVLARPAPEWGTVATSVSESLLRSTLRSQGDLSGHRALTDSGDQRLEYVSAQLSKINDVSDLDDVFELIAAEVGADAVCLSRWLRDLHSVETVLDTADDEQGSRYNLAKFPSTAHVLTTGEAVQVLVSDPAADYGEVALLGRLGYESLLMVPVVCRDERIGLLEAYSAIERPWTRSEINRARIISYQLGGVLDGLGRTRPLADAV